MMFRISTKPEFVPFGQQIWLQRAILVSDWLMLNKSSPLKLLGQMEPNLAGSIYVRYSEKIFFNISQSEKRIALDGHVYWPNGTK
jgi:hypothetical protein